MGFIGTLAVKVIADTKDYEKNIEGAKKKASQIGGSMMKVGGIMTAGLTAPIIGAGIAAMNMASDVDESISKVNTLFAGSADGVVKWSDTTAEGFGIAKADALEYAGELGNVLIAQGLAGDEAADMAVDMVELAADMASFNNASPEETFAAIQAGAIGSSEPLRKYGVVIMEASVQQKALEMTGKATKDELTEQDKTMARLKLITEQTAAAHGDFAKTSDGLANSTRIAQASFKDAAAELGKNLLPIGIKVIGMVQKAISWFNNLTEGQKRVITIVIAVVAAIGPLIAIIGGLISVISAAIPIVGAIAAVLTFPLIAIIGAVIAIVALLVTAWKRDWGGIQGKTKAVVAWLKTTFDNLISWIKFLWEKGSDYFNQFKDKVTDALDGIRKAIQWVIDKAKKLLEFLGIIKVPNALERHSPSPMEESLLAVADAMDEVNKRTLPGFMVGELAGSTSNVTYELNYQGVQSTEQGITGHLDRLRLMRR
jgi:hypothetical protein